MVSSRSKYNLASVKYPDHVYAGVGRIFLSGVLGLQVTFGAQQLSAQQPLDLRPVVFIWAQSSPAKEARPMGSGFILGGNGAVLTARHIVEALDGENLLVSISVKSSPRVPVSMGNIVCDIGSQDFCILSIPPGSVTANGITAFPELSCHIPPRGEVLTAAGFFAAGEMNSGVVTPDGKVIGELFENGLIPTSIPLERGMSGGPVFDASGSVIGLVKGGSTQFGHVQPLQSAGPTLSGRGFACPL